MSNWVLISTANCAGNPRHHIWSNKGWWYLRVTMLNTETHVSVQRRYPLRTRELDVAMRRRDKALAFIINLHGQVVRKAGGRRPAEIKQ